MSEEIERDQRLRMLYSAGLVRLRDTKLGRTRNIKGVLWPNVVLEFAVDFGWLLSNCLARGSRPLPASIREHPLEEIVAAVWEGSEIEFWKTHEDAMLLREYVLHEEVALYHMAAFYKTVVAMDLQYAEFGLGVHGCAWLAGFPLRNKEIRIMPNHQFTNDLQSSHGEGERLISRSSFSSSADNVGIEVDAGLRLAEYSARRRVVVSLELADFLTQSGSAVRPHDLKFHHVGWRMLKRCYDELSYPIIWISTGEKEPVMPWEESHSELTAHFFNAKDLSASDIQELIREVRERSPDVMVPKPYFSEHDETSNRQAATNSTEQLLDENDKTTEDNDVLREGDPKIGQKALVNDGSIDNGLLDQTRSSVRSFNNQEALTAEPSLKEKAESQAFRLFLSYSHDSDEHREWVRRLADRLSEQGLFVRLDQYELYGGRRITPFMVEGIVTADKVICICTDRYNERAEQSKGGVGVEGMILNAKILASVNTDEIIPVLRNVKREPKFPRFLGDRLCVNMSDGENPEVAFRNLLDAIYSRPPAQRPS